jgi:N-acetylmuramoyl-L-alanine amidase
MARIAIDGGHGGHDPGAVANGLRESDVVLNYARTLDLELAMAGHEVLMTREADIFVPLSERARMANAWEAEAFLSLHTNAASAPVARGAWVIHGYGSERGRALARAIWRELATVPGALDLDPEEEVYPDASPWVGGRRLTVLRRTACPAVLVELGFLTSLPEVARLRDESHRIGICQALGRAVGGWLGT